MFVGKYAEGSQEVTFAFKDGTLTIVKNVSFSGAHQVENMKCALIELRINKNCSIHKKLIIWQ